jgi:hypothetical protein
MRGWGQGVCDLQASEGLHLDLHMHALWQELGV